MNGLPVLIQTSDLCRSVQDSGIVRAIVKNVSCSFYAGTLYIILGDSGAGKSSFLRLLNRLDEPDSGTVCFQGKDIRRIHPCELRRQVGFLFEAPFLFPNTVEDNLRYAHSELSQDRCEELIFQSGLTSDFLRRDVSGLSSGERQRVAIARLLATDPKVMLLDEPTSKLDPKATERIEELVESFVTNPAKCIIMVTHSQEQARRLRGETLLMSAGRFVDFKYMSNGMRESFKAESRNSEKEGDA